MSRSATAPELAVLAKKERQVTHRIKVQNGSGTMIDYSNWLISGKIERDVDQPVDGCTLNFVRSKSNQSVIQSLSPLRTDSIINRLNDGVTYGPALDLNRVVTVDLATTAIGVPVLEADYKPLFKGTIDVVNFEQNPVAIVCRDLGAPLVDRWIETETNFGSGVPGSGVGGTAIQTVMQNILDSVFGGGVYTLYTPVSPGADLNTYKQQRMSVMDALQDLAQQIGWDIRFRWDDGTSTFRLTLSNPPRTKTTPDYTFGPNAFYDITDLSLDITNIRNAITGSYRNANNLGNRETITVTDATSISKYGRRFMLIQEADVSPIDSSSEMTTMVTAALADLKEPKADQGVVMPLHWTADLWDLYRYSPNNVHYDTNQDIAVVELTHDFSPKSHRTSVKVRGTPIGQYTTWRGRGGPIGGPTAAGQAFAPYPFIAPRNTEANDTTWDLRFNALNGSGGGGTNLTYTVKSKKTFGTEATLSSGNASAFPLDLTVTRDLKQDAVITFTVTDAATGLFANATFDVPAFVLAITASGTVISNYFEAGTVSTRNRCKVGVGSVSGMTISNTTDTAITLSDEKFDVGSLHDNATNNTRITIPSGATAGLWIFKAEIDWDSNATGERRLRIVKNGATTIGGTIMVGSGGTLGPTQQALGFDDSPTSGDYYEAFVYQDSGGNLGIAKSSTFSAEHLW
jgi:hypothetical protein